MHYFFLKTWIKRNLRIMLPTVLGKKHKILQKVSENSFFMVFAKYIRKLFKKASIFSSLGIELPLIKIIKNIFYRDLSYEI